MSTLSAHVLDAAHGRPAVGMALVLTGPGDAGRTTATTDDDGRVRFEDPLEAGPHRLVLASGDWFAAAGREHFHPEIAVAFVVDPAEEHYHLAVLLSPFSYTTYRGS